MAVAGGGAAYQRLQVPDNAISDSLQYWGGIKARADEGDKNREAARGVEDRAREERRDIAKKKEKEDRLAQLGTDISSLDDVITNIDDIDTANSYIIKDGVNELRNIHLQLAEEGLTDRERVDLEVKRNNILKLPSLLKQNQEKFITGSKAFTEGYANGSVSKWNEGKLGQISSVFDKKDFVEKLDQRGRPVALIKDPETGGYVEVPLTEALQGDFFSDVVSTYKFDAETNTYATNLGKRVKSSTNGYYDISTQSFDSQEANVREDARVMMGTLENPSDVAKSIWTDKMGNKAKTLTKEDMAEIEETFVNTIRAKYDEAMSRKFQGTRYSTDYRIEADKNKPKSYQESRLGSLKFDAQQAANNDDLSFLVGKVVDGQRITSAVSSGDSVIMYNAEGKKISIPKTEGSIVDFALTTDEFKRYKGDRELVLSPKVEPLAYRTSTPYNSPLNEVFQSFFEGDSFNGDDTKFVAELKNIYPNANISEVSKVFENNNIIVNGTQIDLDDKRAIDIIDKSLNNSTTTTPKVEDPKVEDPKVKDPIGVGSKYNKNNI